MHCSVQVIESAHANDVHLLCIPSHTTHILQPLDVGVFKPLKSNFSKACKCYIAAHPGQVITTDLIASILAQAWPESLTLDNMSGFKKCGNPGEITDRQLAPSKAFHLPQKELTPDPSGSVASSSSSLTRSPSDSVLSNRSSASTGGAGTSSVSLRQFTSEQEVCYQT